ncbi:hypothetical protein BKA65DRAFT_473466 [Rhexocercosporidium sp. MPI-PUGE-AT-0058]|nr:hypothetical protein BKA65DRAFT_473466 [Rhexocercosporidium sp. MPI-PUGE-AT-0058]
MPSYSDPPVKRIIPLVVWEPGAKPDCEVPTRKEGDKENQDQSSNECQFNSVEHPCGHRSDHPTLPRITHASPCTCLGAGQNLRPSKASAINWYDVTYNCLDCFRAAEASRRAYIRQPMEEMATISASADEISGSSALSESTITAVDLNGYSAKVGTENAKREEASQDSLEAKIENIMSNWGRLAEDTLKLEAEREARRKVLEKMMEEDKLSRARKEERQKELAAAASKEGAKAQASLRPGLQIVPRRHHKGENAVLKAQMNHATRESEGRSSLRLKFPSQPVRASTEEFQAERKRVLANVALRRTSREAARPISVSESRAATKKIDWSLDPTTRRSSASPSAKEAERTRASTKASEDSSIPSDFWYDTFSKTRIPQAPTDLDEWKSLRSRAIRTANEHGDPSHFIAYYTNKFLIESVAKRAAAINAVKNEAENTHASSLLSSMTGKPAVSDGKTGSAKDIPGNSSKPVQQWINSPRVDERVKTTTSPTFTEVSATASMGFKKALLFKPVTATAGSKTASSTSANGSKVPNDNAQHVLRIPGPAPGCDDKNRPLHSAQPRLAKVEDARKAQHEQLLEHAGLDQKPKEISDSATAGSTKTTSSASAQGKLVHGGHFSLSPNTMLPNETHPNVSGADAAMAQSTFAFAGAKPFDATKAKHQSEELPTIRMPSPLEPSYPFSAYRDGGLVVTNNAAPDTFTESSQAQREKQYEAPRAKMEALVRVDSMEVPPRATSQTTTGRSNPEKYFLGIPLPKAGGTRNASSPDARNLLHDNLMIPLMSNTIQKHDILAASIHSPNRNAASAMIKDVLVAKKDLAFNLLADDSHSVGEPRVKEAAAATKIKLAKSNLEERSVKPAAEDKTVKAASETDTTKSAPGTDNPVIDHSTRNPKSAYESKRSDSKRLVARDIEDEWVDLAPNPAAVRELARRTASTSVAKKHEAETSDVKDIGGEWEDLSGDEEAWDFC